MPEEAVVVLVTAGSEDEAARIAHAVVAERLAACVNVIGPIRSIYRWQDAVEDAREWLMIAKARAADVASLAARIRALHSYDVPECIVITIEDGSAAYLDWIGSSVSENQRNS